MNQYGVAVSDMTVKNVRTPDDPAKLAKLKAAAKLVLGVDL